MDETEMNEPAENLTDPAPAEQEGNPEETPEESKAKKHLFRKSGKRGKKALIWVIVACVAAGGTWCYFQYTNKKKAAAASTSTYVRTVTLSKGSLENTVTADGTIASQDTSNVTTELKYVVKTVNVAVGDTVSAGDTIVTLDTDDLEKQIERKEEADADSLEKLQKAVTDAGYSKESSYKTMADAKTALATAQTTYDNANAVYQAASSSISSFTSNYNTIDSLLYSITSLYNSCTDKTACTLDGQDTLISNYAAACKAIQDEGATVSSAGGSSTAVTCTSFATTDTVQKLFDEVNTVDSAASSYLSSVQNDVNYTNAEKDYTIASSALTAAQSAYDKAAQNFNTVNAQYIEAQDNLAKGVTDDDLEDLKTDLANCTLKAETAGTVTAINATVGSAASGTVATISNTNLLQITVSVDEYDIQSIQKGMTATITSDAIDSTLNGTVTTVSPVATTSNSGQSSSSFNVTVTINDSTDALLIGMSAEVKIILSSTGDVYTVPLDAVGTDDSGNSVIYVKNDAGEFEPVVVTTGDSNDYYIEVSGSDLSDGMTVRASADETAAAVATASASASSDSALNFNMGGSSSGGGDMGGGQAPSGGGGAPSGGGPGGN